MDAVTGYFMALGLSTAAGLNAYVPLLAVGLLSRFTDLIALPGPWDHLGDPLVLAAIGVVGLADFVGDKVPVVDHVLHLIGLAVAPIVGGILAMAAAKVVDVDPGLMVALGVVVALATHAGRTAARPVSTVTTAGAGNPFLSLGEDGVSGALSVTAVVWPAIAASLASLVLIAVFVVWRRWRVVGLKLQGRDPAGDRAG
ncbi:MAG: DUF4126 domain-containing protein [Actinomycetota bacterium]